jgi:hypothetical protein
MLNQIGNWIKKQFIYTTQIDLSDINYNHNLLDIEYNLSSSKFRIFILSYIGLAVKFCLIDSDDLNDKEEKELSIILSKAGYPYDEIQELINSACFDNALKENYINKILYLYPKDKLLHMQLIKSLVKLGVIDHYLTKGEMELLTEIATIFGFDNSVIKEILQEHLSLSKKEFINQISNISFKEFIRQNHPDNFAKYKDIAAEYLEIINMNFILGKEFYTNNNKRKA